MKQLELNLQKRLLIVEYPDKREAEIDLQTHKAFPESDKIVICLGSEFTDKIAERFIDIHEKGAIEKYPKAFKISYTRFLNAFIDVIESEGYHWGDNPIQEPKLPPFYNPNLKGSSENDIVDYRYEMHQFNEAESKTFNLDTTLIFIIPV